MPPAVLTEPKIPAFLSNPVIRVLIFEIKNLLQHQINENCPLLQGQLFQLIL
jgi:hypothetical protein